MDYRTRNSYGEWIDSELDDEILVKVAVLHNTSVQAVVLALKTYDDIAVDMPDVRPGPEMARRLEVDQDFALDLVFDYVTWDFWH